MTTPKTYYPALDALRLISILAVILIHTTTKTFETVSLNIKLVPVSLFLNQICRFAVPLFFMISGFVLELNYPLKLNYWQYFKKRLNKILIPYVFWSLIYVYLIYPQTNPNLLNVLIYGSASHQLYFIPAILIFYLFFPLLHQAFRFLIHPLTLIIFALIELYLLYLEYHTQSLHFFFPLGVASYNFFFFVLGMFASHHSLKMSNLVNKFKTLLIGLVFGLAVAIFWQGRTLYLHTGNYIYFYHNWRPLVLPYTLTLSALLYNYFSRSFRFINLIKTLAGLSFFVFFFHLIVMETLWSWLFQKIFTVQPWFDLLFFFSTTLISFLIAYFSRKIPYLSRLTG